MYGHACFLASVPLARLGKEHRGAMDRTYEVTIQPVDATNWTTVVDIEAANKAQAARRALEDWGRAGDKVIEVKEK